MRSSLLKTAAICFALTGCSLFEREPGPAERIGRSIDDIRKSIGELAPEETPAERRAREDREWRRRQDEYYRGRRDRPYDSDYNDSRDNNPKDSYDIYRDSKEREREDRDREYWDDPLRDNPRDSDRY